MSIALAPSPPRLPVLTDRKPPAGHARAGRRLRLPGDAMCATIRPTMPMSPASIAASPVALCRRVRRRAPRLGLAALLALALGAGASEAAPPESAAALRERFAAVRAQPRAHPFGEPVYLQALESADRAQGDVYALIAVPYAEARPALERIDDWCRILTLHLNVKYCRPSGEDARKTLTVGVAPKYEQSLSSVNWVQFGLQPPIATDEYLRMALRASSGPFGTGDYGLSVELTPFEGRTLLHLSYGYSFGLTADAAMQAYLATLGRNKVGFTVTGRQADGQPIYVQGLRGVIERNVMRYYFAFDAYLGAQRRPPQERLVSSLQDWFDATERYPRQLHEVSRHEYLDMKLREFARQQVATPPPQ